MICAEIVAVHRCGDGLCWREGSDRVFLACPRLSSPLITLQIVTDNITEASLLVSASAFILQVLLHVSYMSLTCLSHVS